MTEIIIDDLEYNWKVLGEVSRSFALPISKLPEITRDIYCVSYNICREVDTIEDSREKDVKEKRKQLDEFKIILLEERVTNPEGFTKSVAEVAQKESEADLIRNTGRVIKVFSGFPPKIKDSVKNWISYMIYGMKEFLGREIKTLQDQDKYCYYVAGTVGNMLTEINYYRDHINLEEFSKLKKVAGGFGIGLQKVNIIKNIRTDFIEGRRYWPLSLFEEQGIKYEDLFKSKNLESSLNIVDKLIVNAQQHLFSGLNYTLLIPPNQKGLRTYCLIPLFMALATLSECYNNSRVLLLEEVKISREKVEEIVKKSEEYSQNDFRILSYFDELKVKT